MKDDLNVLDKDKEKQMLEVANVKEEKKKITIDERNRISEKARRVMETGKGERLTKEEEEILQEITGVVYVAYKAAIDHLDKKKQGGIEYEK